MWFNFNAVLKPIAGWWKVVASVIFHQPHASFWPKRSPVDPNRWPSFVIVEPKLYYYESTLTWDSSARFCTQLDRGLCSYEELCPDIENGGKQFIGDVLVGDHWLATKGRDWLQVGNGNGTYHATLIDAHWNVTGRVVLKTNINFKQTRLKHVSCWKRF